MNAAIIALIPILAVSVYDCIHIGMELYLYVAETYPLRETKPYLQGTLQYDKKQDVPESRLPPPPGFILPEESRGSFYAQQPPYNPSFKLDENIVTAESKLVNDERIPPTREEGDKENGTSTSNALDTCMAYCIIAVIVAAFVAVLVCIIYFTVNNPGVVRLLHKMANEAKTVQHNREDAVMQKILNLTNYDVDRHAY